MSGRKLTCRECGKVFKVEGPGEKKRVIPQYSLTAEGTICTNRPECRGRQLSAEFEKRGIKKWARRSQGQLLIVMDVPPEGWDKTNKKKWLSVQEVEARVAALIEFSSVCWPVCLPYAVQTDPDGEPTREFGEWKRHTHRSLAAVLGVHQSTVTRAINSLKRTHQAEEVEGRIYPNFDPNPLTLQERDAHMRIRESDLKDLAALSRKTLSVLREVRAVASPDVYKRIKLVADDACTRLNGKISDARAEANKVVLDACGEHVSLSSRLGERQTPPPSASSSSSTVVSKPTPSHLDGDADDSGTPLKELYEAGLGKGALAKLPRPRSLPATVSSPKGAQPADPNGFPVTVEEFHRALCQQFQQAGKPVPVLKQSAPVYAALGKRCVLFLDWLARTKKCQRIKHPGVLPDLVTEFQDEVTSGRAEEEENASAKAAERNEARRRRSDEEVSRRLREHPEDCPGCHGSGTVGAVPCDLCPAGQQVEAAGKAGEAS